MRTSSLLPLLAMLGPLAVEVAVHPAKADDDPANLSCITENSADQRKVLRDCAKDPVPHEVVVLEPSLTPSDPPPYPADRDSGKGNKGGSGNQHDRSPRGGAN
ncbi:MAG TPA: hypothetical protein PLR41_13170 [Alphaproteobacteria bacterium]|nr:hypothetical protein [Alphaproteobacteria bacterium]